MKDDRLAASRKYFIFKIQDLVNNSFHTLEEKRIESIYQYLEVCINTYDDLRMSLDQSKLRRAYEGLLEGLDYQLQNHPLNYIYRLRNQLIHSAAAVDDSLEYVSFRLYRYVNSVLSTILYYEEKNSLYNIIDILSSIDATYLEYSSRWLKEGKKKKRMNDDADEFTEEEGYQMVRPKYLFLE